MTYQKWQETTWRRSGLTETPGEDLVGMAQVLRTDMLELAERMDEGPFPEAEDRYQELRTAAQFVSWVLSQKIQDRTGVSRPLLGQLQKINKAQQRMGRARQESTKEMR